MSDIDELLATLGGLRVLDAVWFCTVARPHAKRIAHDGLYQSISGMPLADEYAFLRIDGTVYRLGIDETWQMLAIDVLEPENPEDALTIASVIEYGSVGPHVVEIRGRCTCIPREHGCVDALYAVDDARDLVVLDVGTVVANELLRSECTMRRLYSAAGIDAPWLRSHGEATLR